MSEPHLAHDVIVFVERGGVDPERHPATAPDRLADRCDPARQMQVRARVGRDHGAGGRDRVELVGACGDAMGQRQPRREKAKRAEPFDNAFGIGAVGEGALSARLQEMHVHAPAGGARSLGDRCEKRVRAPLRTVGAELHGEGRALDRLGNRLDPVDLFLDARQGAEEGRSDGVARGVGQRVKERSMVAVDERIAVAHEDREGHAHADLVRRASNRARLLDRRHGPVEARVMRHDRARPAARRPAESRERAKIGVDRRHRGEAEEPGLERLAGRAERSRRQRPAMIVCIGERRQREKSTLRRARGRYDCCDAAIRDDDIDRGGGRRAVGRQKNDAGDHWAHRGAIWDGERGAPPQLACGGRRRRLTLAHR